MTMFDEELILEVQKHDVLYNKGHPRYTKNHVRKEAWEEIGKSLRKEAEECKQRWRILRDSFSKYRRQKKLMSSGSAGKKIKQWHLNDKMEFLIPFLEVNRTRRNYELSQCVRDVDDPPQTAPSILPTSMLTGSEELASMPGPSTNELSDTAERVPQIVIKKRRKSVTDENFETLMNLISQPNDPDELFMLSQADGDLSLDPYFPLFM